MISPVPLLTSFSANPADAHLLFDRLVAAYSEPHRFYHTLEHIHDMLAVAAKLTAAAADPGAIELAIWFHDAVYDPKAKDNEDRSAELAIEWLRPLRIPEEILRHVAAMIRATAHTSADVFDADTSVLLDADLAILSADESRYARYAADIRREYAWVEESAYRAGRAKVLQGFLARPRIYRTERMHTIAENAARRNLGVELEQLQS
ncbi:MAG TPA: hypothetical protein VKD90_06375 [Gemmataceae bacterium]|nr:hypothetical protein [Gemmataceae bacterium]